MIELTQEEQQLLDELTGASNDVLVMTVRYINIMQICGGDIDAEDRMLRAQGADEEFITMVHRCRKEMAAILADRLDGANTTTH